MPARFMGLQHTFGSVEKGKMADLVLLAKNPLDNIRHSQTITAVIYQGKVYNRRALDDMLLKTAQMAK
ncbi:MAG: amidohydrolase family protein [Algicola sp.]|nr:amidohydrolase family protein [Algicola sp.]